MNGSSGNHFSDLFCMNWTNIEPPAMAAASFKTPCVVDGTPRPSFNNLLLANEQLQLLLILLPSLTPPSLKTSCYLLVCFLV